MCAAQSCMREQILGGWARGHENNSPTAVFTDPVLRSHNALAE